jgi:ABC-2 type transport system ATP-binding protein
LSGIVLTDLTKSYGAFPVLRGISLNVEPGELFGFLGPNGAGKTTTIKIMTSLLLPSGGRVEVAGYDVVEDPYEVKRRVGFVPNPATVRERSRDLIELFDLGEWIDELIEAYSHGMRQKLAMTSALLHEPEVIIIDEPTVGLDPRSQSRMKTLLSDLTAKGHTVFLSTHTLEIAEALCTRVAIIHRGEIIARGTIDELRREARREDSSLEEIFLGLTEGGGPVGEPSLV